MKKEKKFESPELIIVYFEGDVNTDGDNISTSGIGDIGFGDLE